MNLENEIKKTLTRRHFFGRSALGLGAMALGSLLNRDLFADTPKSGFGALPNLHFPAKAKRIIYIFQAGGPAQMELFDYKPRLKEWHGKELPPSVRGTQRLTGFTSGQSSFPIIASPFKFSQHGKSGAWLSELLPYTAGVVDDMTIIKSMHTEAINHDPGVTFMLTGNQQPGRPSIGSWLSYGIGSENSDIPAFVVLISSASLANAATPLSSRHWGAGFLPSRHQGVKFRSGSSPVLHLPNPPGIDATMRREMLDAGMELNRIQHEAVGDPEITARIAQYEMAYRMQSSVPGLMDISKESQSTLDLYGTDVKTPGSFAANCLLARRLSESGVRFVQIFDRDWDHHSSAPNNMRAKTKMTDQGTAALLKDLKQRGLLDETLVVCGGEFGRTVYCQGMLQENYGRDHHGRCFTMWMAGGGIKGGISHGETDDHCYNIVKDPVHVHDLHATLLHCLGIDHEKLTYKFQGRHFRLTDVHGQVVKAILG